MRRAARAAFNGITFATGLILACWLIRSSLPVPKVPIVQAKLEHLARRVDEYDTLILGSSRVFHQIIPARLDQRMAEHGLATRSFNCGVDGMRPPEDAYVLDQILRSQPRNLRWVILELEYLRMPLDADKKGTIRAVYWHDWSRMVLLARRAFGDDKKRKLKDRLRRLREPLGDLAEHGALFVQNMTNIGRAEVLTQFLTRKRAPGVNWHSLGDRKDGFITTGRPEMMLEENRLLFERERAQRLEAPARSDAGDPVSRHALRQMLEKIRSIGARPILVVPPTTSKKNFVPGPDVGTDLVVLDFSDVQRFSVLYESRHRLDTDHVNMAGAEIFTDLFAEAFAAAVARQSDPSLDLPIRTP